MLFVSVTPPWGLYFKKKFPYLGQPVLGSTLEHTRWEASPASLETSGLPQMRMGTSEERVNGAQVQKAHSCRYVASRKGDSRWPSSQQHCSKQHPVVCRAGQETWPRGARRRLGWRWSLQTPQGCSLSPPLSCLELKGMTSPRVRAPSLEGLH